LTSKPYAFRARPWELQKTETIDVHDAVGSNIRVDARGNEIMRVLPRVHEGVNEEWISDKTRFAHDGLKRQRLDRPYVRDAASGKLREADWDEALNVVAEKLGATPAERVAAMVGDLCDAESMMALKDLMTGLGVSNLDCRTDGTVFDPAQRCGYIFNTTIAGLEEADAILLVGTNPRWEAALVNARIRKTWLAKRIPIGLIGEKVDLTYPVTHIGAGPESLSALMDGKHSFAEMLKKAKNPVMIVGQGVFLRPDGAALQAMLRGMAEKLGFVRDGWNGFNVLQMAASRVGALDIGFLPQKKDALGAYDILNASKAGGLDVLYLLGVDEFDVAASVGDKTFVIYQGSHGDQGAARADVILPGCAYTEKDGLYVNLEGRVQMAKKAVFAPGDAREDWKILRALSIRAGKTLSYDTLYQLRQRIIGEFPAFGKIDQIAAPEWAVFGTPGTVGNAPLRSPLSNFYMTNSIARSSQTMAACTQAFVASQEKTEAAE
jgi:NADH-quinone oxidoreductase subunit G